MGHRISYLMNKTATPLSAMVVDQYPAFRQWTREAMVEFGPENRSPALLQLLEEQDQLPARAGMEQVVLDEFVSEFVGYYCDHGPGAEWYQMVGPCMGSWRYKESSKLVEQKLDSTSVKLWNYQIQGRSLKGDQPFTTDEDDYQIGFWSYEEQQHLLNALTNQFGDLKTVRQTYWTNEETQRFEQAVKRAKTQGKKFVSLNQHQPISEGIEFTIEALQQAKPYQSELVLGIG